MEPGFFLIFFAYFQVATSQYYAIPVSTYPSYYSSYGTSNPSLTTKIAPKAQKPTLPSLKLPKSQPKRSVGNTGVKCSPQTASAYFLTPPSERVKATVLTKDKVLEKPVKYNCPLCNNFADVVPNSKILPPPPLQPVLPGIIDTVPTIVIPKNLTTSDPNTVLPTKTTISDMCEKHRNTKKLSFDQELLEGFLTGLGIAQ